jgi:hypothetical protein
MAVTQTVIITARVCAVLSGLVSTSNALTESLLTLTGDSCPRPHDRPPPQQPPPRPSLPWLVLSLVFRPSPVYRVALQALVLVLRAVSINPPLLMAANSL